MIRVVAVFFISICQNLSYASFLAARTRNTDCEFSEHSVIKFSCNTQLKSDLALSIFLKKLSTRYFRIVDKRIRAKTPALFKCTFHFYLIKLNWMNSRMDENISKIERAVKFFLTVFFIRKTILETTCFYTYNSFFSAPKNKTVFCFLLSF